jgi:hypothetical protein
MQTDLNVLADIKLVYLRAFTKVGMSAQFKLPGPNFSFLSVESRSNMLAIQSLLIDDRIHRIEEFVKGTRLKSYPPYDKLSQ